MPKIKREALTKERLKQALDYDSATGVFTRKRINVKNKGVVGYKCPRGYMYIRVNYQRYEAHRLAWLYVYGWLPKSPFVIDHKNRNPSDNRIDNLRIADRAQNNANSKNRDNTSSRFRGVCWDSSRAKWLASICIRGKLKNLGRFDSEEAAAGAYRAAAEKLYGDFVRSAA